MKKSVILISAVLMCIMLSLVGCGSKPTNNTDKVDNNVTPDVKLIKDRGVLKAGVKVDAPRFGYKDPNTGNIEGLEVDLVKAVAKKIFGSDTKVELVAVTSKTRGAMLDSGDIDVAAATFTITEERKTQYNFAEGHYTDGIGLLVKKASNIKSFKDLENKKIGVAQATTAKNAIQQQADKTGIKVTFVEFPNYSEVKAALDSGAVDCFSTDAGLLFGYVDNNTQILSELFNPQNYGIATKKGNDGLAKIVNDTIIEMKSSGELDKLIEKWNLK